MIRFRGSRVEQRVKCARIIDCRGIRRDPERNATPVVASLLREGLARLDPLRRGLDVGPEAAVIDTQGRPSDRIFAIGPAPARPFGKSPPFPTSATRPQDWRVG